LFRVSKGISFFAVNLQQCAMLNLNEVLDNKENGELERFLINTMPLFKGNGETTKTMMMITTYLKMHGKKNKGSCK
jgi:hypothetical protein